MNKFIPITITKPFLEIVREQRFLTGMAVFYIFSVCWGAYRFHSSVPVADMWEGYLEFYMQIQDGNLSAWWGQHNEHRIVLSRILFYLDFALFGGESRLLITANVLLLFGVWYVVLIYADHFLHKKVDEKKYYFLLILLTVFSLSWKQDENIVWGLQSSFWFAYLIPLLAFFFLARSASDRDKEIVNFGLAYLCGVLSAGSMANGILVLPVLTLMSVALKKKSVYSLLLGITALLVIAGYLYDYKTPAGHVSFVTNVMARPWQSLVFFIEYVGVPPKNIYVSFVFGLLHLYLIAIVLLNVRRNLDNPFYLSVVAFLLYYLASGIIVSGGRVNLGFNAAMESRYTTPALISVSLSLILYLYLRPEYFHYFGRRTVVTMAVLMLGSQAAAVIKRVGKIHDARDRETMYMVVETYFEESMKVGSYESFYRKAEYIANRAYARHLGVFGREPFVGKREKLGTRVEAAQCQRIRYTRLAAEPVLRLSVTEKIPVDEAVYIANSKQQIIGYGLPSRQYSKAISVILGPALDSAKDEMMLYRCQPVTVRG